MSLLTCLSCPVLLCPVRFEVEENELVADEMERLRLGRYDPVIYCYELQLHPSVHRKGLGKRLMQMLELVVRQQRVLILWTAQAGGVGSRRQTAAVSTACITRLWHMLACGDVLWRVVLLLLLRRLSNSACTW
jgi:GNAT superfamily N-acetyltransferase